MPPRNALKSLILCTKAKTQIKTRMFYRLKLRSISVTNTKSASTTVIMISNYPPPVILQSTSSAAEIQRQNDTHLHTYSDQKQSKNHSRSQNISNQAVETNQQLQQSMGKNTHTQKSRRNQPTPYADMIPQPANAHSALLGTRQTRYRRLPQRLHNSSPRR